MYFLGTKKLCCLVLKKQYYVHDNNTNNTSYCTCVLNGVHVTGTGLLSQCDAEKRVKNWPGTISNASGRISRKHHFFVVVIIAVLSRKS